jgi:hypothetical protein
MRTGSWCNVRFCLGMNVDTLRFCQVHYQANVIVTPQIPSQEHKSSLEVVKNSKTAYP